MSQSNNMSLILENWRGYLDRQQTAGITSTLIYETKGELRQVDFAKLLKEVNSGMVSQDRAYLIYEQAFNYGERQLIDEGIMDLAMKLPGMEKVGELVGAAGEKIKAAWEKVNNFYLDMVLKAIELASSGAKAFVMYANKIFSAIGRFQEKHPTLYKIIMAILFAVLIYAVFGSSNAQAAVKVGSTTLDDFSYQAIQGALNKAAQDPDLAMVIGKAQVALENAHKSQEVIDISQLGPIVDEALTQVLDVMSKVGQDDSDAIGLLSRWVKVGESLRFSGVGI